VIELRLSIEDVSRTRFAYSPLAEVAESLFALFSGRVHPLYEPWLPSARTALACLARDHRDLLAAIVPARPRMASFLFVGSEDPSTTIEHQLEILAGLPTEHVRSELEQVWANDSMPPPAQRAIARGRAGVQEIADALFAFWDGAIERHWPRMRRVLDADLAHRVSQLTSGSYGDLLNGLHPKVTVTGDCLQIDTTASLRRETSGQGLFLVPSVFAWPNLVASTEEPGRMRLVYGARGVARLWEQGPETEEDDPLGALLGRSRSAILVRLDLPHSTTQLARLLGQSPPSISQHLSVLRRAALVTSWRSGRSVLYQRTPLATSLLQAAVEPSAAACS